MNRQLRARLLLEEARALGLDVDDLVAAATGDAKPITVAAWIDEIAATFTPATTATYRPYWRLTARLLGDRYLAELTPADLAVVVDVAAERARLHRPDSTGRASRETCIAALRALYARAVDAGHLTANPCFRGGPRRRRGLEAFSVSANRRTPPSRPGARVSSSNGGCHGSWRIARFTS